MTTNTITQSQPDPPIYISNIGSIDNEITGNYRIDADDIPCCHRYGNFFIDVSLIDNDHTIYLDQFHKYRDELMDEIMINDEIKALITEMKDI